jgi:hypothetical protein
MANETDILDLVATFSETAKRLMSGQDLEKTKVTLEVELPNYLIQSATALSAMLKMTPNAILSKIVEGAIEEEINKSTKTASAEVQQQASPAKQLEDLKGLFDGLGINFSGVTDSLKKLDGLVGQIQSVQKTADNLSKK